MQAADEDRIGIELPPLNTTLVEVHRELATVRNGSRDMVTKKKCLKKAEKYAEQQLADAQKQITDLEQQLQSTPTAGPPPAKVTHMQEEVTRLATSLAKAEKEATTAEVEIGRLRDELRQSLDREKDGWATTRKVDEEPQEQLQVKTSAHQ